MPRGYIEFVLTSLLLVACGSGQTYHERSTPTAAANHLREQLLDDRPKLVLIERAGDAATAIAFAARTSEAPIANYGLSRIIQSRLAKAGIVSEASPNGFGLTFVTLARDQREATASIDAVRRALALEVRLSDFDRQFLDAVTERFGPGTVDAPGDIEVAHCSGQLYRDASQSAALADGATLVRWLETARHQVFSQKEVSFAVVGTPEVAAAVRSTLMSLPAWPRHETPPRRDHETQPNSTLSASKSHEWSISIAWESGSFASTLSAWRALRASDSPLIAQLAGLESSWRVEEISAVAAPSGGCLRVDLAETDAVPSRAALEMSQVVRLALNESKLALLHADAHESDSAPELFGNDPRLTARRAAWRSLSVEHPGRQALYHVSLRAPESALPDVERSVKAALKERSRRIEVRSKVEPGQPEQWMLLASPCGPTSESTQDSGATAAWLRAVARKYSGSHGVSLEPWISDQGMGLFAHAKTPALADERGKLTLRLANTLGRVAATARISGQDLAFTREELLVRVGVQSRRGWALLLDMVSGHKPSLFEPLGTADSIRQLNPSDLLLSRRHWVREPLRAAFTSNEANADSMGVNVSITRWLDPHRSIECPCEPPVERVLSERATEILTVSSDELDASAYLAYDLRQTGTRSDYDLWLEWLLNRRGGWLEQVVIEPGLARTATSYVRGPLAHRVLFIEINSVDESAAAEAVKRIRAALADAAQGGVSAADIALAYRWAQSRSLESALDPRNRLVHIWQGEPAAASRTSGAGFRAFLEKALGLAAPTIIRVRK